MLNAGPVTARGERTLEESSRCSSLAGDARERDGPRPLPHIDDAQKVADTEIMRVMDETLWPSSQVLRIQRDGCMRMTLEFADTDNCYSCPLGWGETEKVPESREVQKDVVNTEG